MKIFVYEFVTGGGMEEVPSPSLLHEADLMVRALIAELLAIHGVEVIAARDPRLSPLAGVTALTRRPGEGVREHFRRGVVASDYTWPTAPETGGVLESLARDTLSLGARLLGSEPEAVRVAASKRLTALALESAGIPVSPVFASAGGVPPVEGPWVVKPDDGAGAEETWQVPDWRAARSRLERAPGNFIAQPWLDGEARSLSLLCAGGESRLLSCNRQRVEVREGRVTLVGLDVNAIADSDGVLARLAGEVAAAIPGLWGYVGIDLIQTAAGPVVLEVNPRLTTSYCGLGEATGINVAALVLELLVTRELPTPAASTPGRSVALSFGRVHAG